MKIGSKTDNDNLLTFGVEGRSHCSVARLIRIGRTSEKISSF